MRKTSIIIPTFNGLPLLKDCVASIRRHTEGVPHEVIVVDNGSTDGTVNFCLQERLAFVSLPANAGFPAACNYGLRAAGGDALLLLNNDILVTPGWLELLLACLESAEDVGMVGPLTNYASGKQQIREPFTHIDDMAARYNGHNPSKWREARRLIGFCLLFKRELVERIGVLDERFSPGHYEDDDYCLRARKAGFRLLIAGDAFVFHHGSQSFGRENREGVRELIERNKAVFMEKWGEDPAAFADD